MYGIKVQATNDIGSSVESDTLYFACATVPSGALESPSREQATDSEIAIAWSEPTDDGGQPISGYLVYMNALDDGDWTLVYDGRGQPTVRHFTVQNLERGMNYRFKSAAINYVGEGLNSTESTLLCAATPAAPGQP